MITEIDTLYSEFDKCALLAQWKNKLVTLGKQVKATNDSVVVEGIATDVTADGALIIRQADGTECTILAGDVTLR